MIYLNNAATTWPKPEATIKAVEECIRGNIASPGRGSHQSAISAGKVVFHTRELMAKLFNVNDPGRIVFSANATEAINLALKGLLQPGDHVITTTMEHNAVARPLYSLIGKGVQVTEVQCSPTGELDPKDIEKALRFNTKAVVCLHASNVIGTIMPIEEIGKITKENGVTFIVDASQTAGFLDVNIEKNHIDLLAFTGHKGLFGVQGTGGLFIREGIRLVPLIEGGTGSKSESLEQPEELPDRYESGTLNTSGLAGLGAGIEYLNSIGLEAIRNHEYKLMKRLIEGLSEIKDVEMYGPKDINKMVPVLSFNIKDRDSSEVAFILDRVFNISCRTGLHCAPSAHRTIGTFDRGTVRLSLSYFNTLEEMDTTIKALEQTVQELNR